MTDIRTKRATRDFARACSEPPRGVRDLELVDNSVLQWTCEVVPPATSLYAGHVFKVILSIPQEYPHVQPEFKFVTSIFNPAVAPDGKVCNNLVKEWKPDMTAGSSLAALIDVVFTNFAEVPPIHEEARNLYDKSHQEFAAHVKKTLMNTPKAE